MKLKGHRFEQLRMLGELGAVSEETAAPVAFTAGLRHVTLSRMAEEGLVNHAHLPFQGNTRRRCSHYWLSDEGAEALQA